MAEAQGDDTVFNGERTTSERLNNSFDVLFSPIVSAGESISVHGEPGVGVMESATKPAGAGNSDLA